MEKAVLEKVTMAAGWPGFDSESNTAEGTGTLEALNGTFPSKVIAMA